jgi:hypothetical protein
MVSGGRRCLFSVFQAISVFHVSSYCMFPVAEKSLSQSSNSLVMFLVAGDYLCVPGAYVVSHGYRSVSWQRCLVMFPVA